MMHLYIDALPEAVAEARDELAKITGCWLVNGAQAAEVPGWSMTELYVGDSLLGADNERVIPLFARLCETLEAARTRR